MNMRTWAGPRGLQAVITALRAATAPSGFAWLLRRRRALTAGFLVVAALLQAQRDAPRTFAANPPPVQAYYVALPEDDLLTLFDENQDTLGSYAQVISPIRSVTSIAVNEPGTLIYWDQWEDGGYDGDIANPGANVYSSSNPDGTQIWGDGVLANGCPPQLASGPNPCAAAADDQFVAGDVIILDNDVAVKTGVFDVLDEFGSVAYDNNDGTQSWATNWVETGDSPNYRDEFSSQQYNLSAGSLDWSSQSWTEVNDDNSPTGGDITVNGTGQELEIGDTTSVGVAIYRQADLSGYSGATLSYAFRDSAGDSTDAVAVEVRNPPAAWTTLTTINGSSGTGTRSHDITSHIDSDTEIRFRVSSALETGDEIYFDDVDIATPYGPGQGDILVSGGELRFSETQPGDSVEREVAIPTNGGVTTASFARLRFFLGYNGVETDGTDELRVDVSANGGSTWTTLGTFGGSPLTNPSIQTFEIGAYAAANTRVRFYQVDALESGEYWTVDDVEIEWGYYRDPGAVYFDGRDKVGATTPIAMSRGAFPPTPGSVMAGGAEMFSVSQWGTSYVAPVGEDTVEAFNASFEDVRWFIMAGSGGATIDVDANGDGDVADAGDLDDFVMTEGSRVSLDGINEGATLTVVGGNPVQVHSMTADDDDTFEFRWDALVPRPSWSNDYYTPVGTNPDADGANRCTEVWVYNPNGSSITVNWDRPGGNTYPTADGSFTVAANSAGVSPAGTNLLTEGNGARFWSTGGQVFSPLSLTDCTRNNTNGRMEDWGAPLVPASQLTGEVLVGWAPGCSNESHSGICHDPDSTAGGTTPDRSYRYSRNVVFVAAIANTTIYVDTNGSGLTCSGGTVTGAEQTQAATALTSYRFDDDPTSRSYVHDNFGTQSYARDDSVDGWAGNQTWTTDWTEGNGESPTSASAGAIQINTAAPASLRFQDDSGANESGRTIQRSHNTSSASYARLSFRLFSAPTLDAGDRLAVEASTDGTSWVTLRTYTGPYVQSLPGPDFPVAEVFNISAYIANPTYIRFRIVDDLESGDYWAIDHAHIDYAVGGDFDMSGALIRTYNADCSGVPIAVAYGQNPPFTAGNDDEALDLGTLVPPYRSVTRRSTIGDYVWVDEDGDGDQDAGEPGIPNVKVTLTGTANDGTTVNLTTYTDADGGYVFADLKPGSYTVSVDPTTLPSGLAANPTYDEDGIATTHVVGVSLPPGEEHVTADFGYNWSSPTETNGNGGTGAIGDRVWIDADGDGAQDPNEIGLVGVSVQLVTAGPDGLFGTSDDFFFAAAVTDYNGNYLFDGLAAGAYEVRIPTTPSGYAQTGDPDDTLDNRTTEPIVLAPGDVYLSADFGYRPDAGTSGSIGDLVWLDANRDNTRNTGEPGLSGVTVALIRDLDGDGTWDAGEPIVATDVTDENGIYGFSGLPVTNGTGTDDYLVWVNDTDHVLEDLAAVHDVRDGLNQGNPASGIVTGYEISAVTDLTTSPVTDADFAYAPVGHDSAEGLIGDTVFLDTDGDGAFDPGEGLEGVTVELLASDGRLVATTYTNEEGKYFFGGLAAGTYTVKVDTTTLPSSGQGLTNTVDPDTPSPGNSQSSVTIATGGVNLAQDFGYRPTGSQPVNAIGGTLWRDASADGTLQAADEPGRFPNVTVSLYADTNGNGVLDGGDDQVAVTSTDSSGSFAFGNLPNGTYFVDVTDTNNVLEGYWKSTGPSPGSDNNSQVDAYKVTVSGGQTNTTADFGYYDQPAGLGDFVWEDLDGDGLQDPGEPGIPGVPVTLTITWPGGAGQTTLRTVTDGDGWYGFGNLVLDEDFNGTTADGSTEPTYSITVATPAGFAGTLRDQGADDSIDSDNSAGQAATVTKGAIDDTYDFGFVRLGAIGDYVWVDEDGDGDQDAGEPGISGARVILAGTALDGTTVNRTTVTDADGGYLFADVPPGSYTVTVDHTTLPSGLAANPTYDEDGVVTAHTSTATLGPGQEYVTADFGYNWAPPADTNGGTNTGAIGDRVWIDADGDGRQDPEEVGLDGVTVELWYDSDADGDIDGQYGAGVLTDANGNYVFDGLPAGVYEVRVSAGTGGYTQTGDPDRYGQPCTTCDARTTTPILLAPGDIFLKADFGYRPDGASGSIGDTVWLDANRDNTQNAGEPGIPGVTVALVRDLDGDGTWDPGEPIIATDVTDAVGQYAFTGLPIATGTGTNDYLVWVNDTRHVLGELEPVYDVRDGASQGAPGSGVVTGLTISAVTNLTSVPVVNADFAFAPRGHDTTEGLIGDTVFLDRDGDGAYDVGEGIEGVGVLLYDSTGTELLQATRTDENGNYSFGSLPAGSYTVKVDAATLPFGVTNTVDPDGGTANESVVGIAAGGVNLLQDFGYSDTTSPNTVAGTLWVDTDADGVLEGGEVGRHAGVTVVLYDAAGNVVATTTTDANGDFSFTGLPDGTYTVDVTDTAGVLGDLWKSNGPSAGSDNNSQMEPYTVTVSGGQVDTTADFGYYGQPAAIGDYVWHDLDADGIQDVGEPGIAGAVVTLVVTYPNGTVTVVTTQTDATGAYAFGNLLLDEDHDGAGTSEPTYVVYTYPTGFMPTASNVGADDAVDSDGSGVTAAPIEGGTDLTYDFGFVSLAAIGDTVWRDADGDGVQDAAEAGIAGVRLTLIDDVNGNGVVDGPDTIIGSTFTDSTGRYLFDNLVPGDYLVDLDGTTLPSGLSATTGTTDPHVVALGIGERYLDADFGYSAATGSSLGDYVWFDADSDAVQDAGEVGIGSVKVTVTGPSGTFVVYTAADGSWLVPGLAAGSYTVTIDPTTLPAGTNTTPTNGAISRTYQVPADTDVLYADFGFDAPPGTTTTIGDTVWLDLDRDGAQDSGEPGIAGVTVVLIRDVNDNGVFDAGDVVIGTDVTDANGLYQFVGVPMTDGTGTDDYLVRVTDTGGLLIGTTQTYDATSPLDGTSRVQDLAGPVDNQDFGYAPPLGAIGNQVWHDLDDDGTYDVGEPGFQGVTVDLYVDLDRDGVLDPTDLRLATATTDALGRYSFTGLPEGDYIVDVTDTAGVLTGFAWLDGPNDGSDGNSQADPYAVSLTAGSRDDRTADFGYQPAGGTGYKISGTTFEDRDNDGATVPTYEPAADQQMPGLPMFLYRDLDGDGALDPGEPLIATTVSGPNGTYEFTDLPDGDYVVATDGTQAFVNGFFQTTQQATSAVEPATIDGADVADQDFGFHAPGGSQTTPVTLAFFEAVRTESGVRLSWSTITESGNVGFRLYGAAAGAGGPTLLTSELVPSRSIDSLVPLDYELSVAGPAAEAYYIEDVDVFGRATRHGPFDLGRRYGERPTSEAIDWSAIRAASESEARLRADGEVDASAQLVAAAVAEAMARPEAEAPESAEVQPAEEPAGDVAEEPHGGVGGDAPDASYTKPSVKQYPVAEVRVRRDGVYRVTYESLRAAGVDLKGISRTRLALANRGVTVPVLVNKTFGPGAWLEFVGEGLDTLYTDANVYVLSVSPMGARQIASDTRSPKARVQPTAWYWQTELVNRQRQYTYSARTSDPWYDSRLLAYAGKPVEATMDLSVDHLAASGGQARLTVGLIGGTDWETGPDHHVRLELNGVQVAEARFDGFEYRALTAEVPAGLVVEGTNRVRVVSTGQAGVEFDVVYVDRYALTYPRAFVARSGALDFEAAGSVLRVDSLPSRDVLVYRLDPSGPVKLTRAQVAKVGSTYSVTFAGTVHSARYLVTSAEAVGAPEASHQRPIVDISTGRAEYLVIAHPDFLDELEPLLAARRADGLGVKMVDVRDVYVQYAGGVFDAGAIHEYVKRAVTRMGTRYVLLAGGDTYDYRDYLGLGSIGFVPSLYVATDEIVQFAPVDSEYADVDGDGVPDAAIGRLPARTGTEMASLVAKTLAYAAKSYDRTAVFAADKDGLGAPFTSHSESFIALLPDGWSVARAHIASVGKTAARTTLIDAMNAGTALTGYVGHSSLTTWSFERLFSATDAAALKNAGKPTVVTQWGCWNTYYVSPAADTMAHKLLLSGDRGAAAVLGSSTLTLSSSEARLGALVTPRLTSPGMRIGDAILEAKRQLAGSASGLVDVQLGWNLLGDPALVIDPTD